MTSHTLENIHQLNLEMYGSGNQSGNQGYIGIPAPDTFAGQSQPQGRPTNQRDWRYDNTRLTPELKNQIVKECCEDLISPVVLASRHGFSVSQIRKIVKAAGQKLLLHKCFQKLWISSFPVVINTE